MEYIQIGKIINTHGLKGELKIESWSDFDEIRYKKGKMVYILMNDEYLPFKVRSFRMHKGFPLVTLEGIQDINLAEQYKNCVICMNADDRHELPKGEFYADELIGMTTEDEEGRTIGEVVSVEETRGAQKNLRIRMAEGKEFLLPDIPYFVLNIDPEKRIIRIHMDEGLL
ncbi:MAG: ribosome maturation factor RimM [Erysipelotrichaceae bacterium]|nr:ribosome maturation factor RimM [Erysipelotrichaceae bacterium]MDO5120695.1 ribosome maturation factor RimM [Erysipelotrichaceae bacterium]